MKIIVKQNEQQPEITIDLTGVHHPFAIRDAIGLALEIDGYTKEQLIDITVQMIKASHIHSYQFQILNGFGKSVVF